MMMWIWVGGLIIALGALVAVWPARRSRAPAAVAPGADGAVQG